MLRENAYVGNCLYGERAVLSVGEEYEVFPSRDQFPVASRQNIGNFFPYGTKPSVDDVYTHRNDNRKMYQLLKKDERCKHEELDEVLTIWM